MKHDPSFSRSLVQTHMIENLFLDHIEYQTKYAAYQNDAHGALCGRAAGNCFNYALYDQAGGNRLIKAHSRINTPIEK